MTFSERMFTFFKDHRGLPFRTMTVFNGLLEATLCGAVLIVLALLARRFLRPRLGNRVIYFAWLLVAIRLLLPVALPNPLMNDLRPTLSADEAARPIADQIRVRAHDAMVEGSRPYLGERYGLGELVYDLGVYTSYGWTGKWVLFGYLAVCGGVALTMLARNIAFLRGLKRARVRTLTSEETVRWHTLASGRNARPLAVWFVDPLPCACLVGVSRPYIALPLSVKPEEFEMVLSHELCHYKAGDHWWALLRNLCCVVHWFNPLVWTAAKCSRFDCELACDDRVTASMTDEERIRYASTLVTSAVRRNAPRVTMLATGMTMNGRRLKKRVAAILRSGKLKRGAILAFSLIACAALVGAFATAENRAGYPSLALERSVSLPPLDNPFYTAWELFEPAALDKRPVTSEEEAIAQAAAYFAIGFLQHAPFRDGATLFSARESPEGWYVSAAAEGEPGCLMLLDQAGGLLFYCCQVSQEGWLENRGRGRLPDNMNECAQSYVSQFAEACFGTAADPCAIESDLYDHGERYLRLKTVIAQNACVFTVRVSPYVELLGFESDDARSLAAARENERHATREATAAHSGAWEAPRERVLDEAAQNAEDTVVWLSASGVAFQGRDMALWDEMYASPPSGALPMGYAFAVGVRELETRYGVTAAELSRYRVEYGYNVDDGYFTTPHWQIDFMDEALRCVYQVRVLSPEGGIEYAMGPGGESGV